jgi:NitT/TauT family transport system substrate-binding protein
MVLGFCLALLSNFIRNVKNTFYSVISQTMRKYILCFLIPMALFTWSCRENENSQPSVIVLKGPSAMELVYLKKNFQDTFNLLVYDDPNQVKAAIVRHEGMFYAIPMNLAALLYNKGINIAVIAVPVWGNIWLAGVDSITSIAALKNRRVYISGKGSTPDIVFQIILKANGLEPGKDVILDYTFSIHQALAQAIVAGKAPLAIVPEPFLSYVQTMAPSFKPLLDIEKEWNTMYHDSIPFTQTAFVVDKKMAAKHPDWVARFEYLARQSVVKVNNDPAGAASIAVQLDILNDSSILFRSIPHCGMRYVSAVEVKDGIDRYLNVFYNFNPQTIGGCVPDEGFIY